MEQAIQYTENMNAFVGELAKVAKSVQVLRGRRFDRVAVDDTVKYFVDRHTWEIFGAKSKIQYNPRRHYGKVDTISDFDWKTGLPIEASPSYTTWKDRENELTKDHKPRGRPRKNP
jgi:hypothetical protein